MPTTGVIKMKPIIAKTPIRTSTTAIRLATQVAVDNSNHSKDTSTKSTIMVFNTIFDYKVDDEHLVENEYSQVDYWSNNENMTTVAASTKGKLQER